ncbi:MAG: MoaD/ThiS family protein [Gemmatimonadota bacterium]
MQVRLLLFASYRDLVGASELTLDLPAGATAQVAVNELRVSFAEIPARPVVAINLEYSSLDELLSEGDELALLPPVAGG